ncbi:T9SS type A sorting domain-containing protein [Rapidithrix thailandica]|uniref:T9SS type A sorting domain-containing protein n=1 Tax=Rapidithrix thailandica TaxID=413964 RepID=A0AAW9SC87_9BACT
MQKMIMKGFFRLHLWKVVGLIGMMNVYGLVTGNSMAIAQKVFTVNVAGDEGDPDAGEPGDDGLCDVDPNTPGEQCTFRAAIQNHNANRHLGQNEINFDVSLPSNGRVTIMVGSTGLGPLPPVLGSVSIDGLNIGNNAGGRVVLDGSMAGSNAIGLQLLGGQCIIRWLVIHSFDAHGIMISGTPPPGEGGHLIENNWIGVDSTGMVDMGNGGDGIFIDDTPDNTIGGEGFIQHGNVISGNGGYAIRIVGQDPDESGSNRSGATNNVVQGNALGLAANLGDPIPNTSGGILIENARDQLIGGESNSEEEKEKVGNKIVGEKNGITLKGSLSKGVRLLGNFIGKDGTGAKFKVGILAGGGDQLTIDGNVLTNIDSVGVEAFLDFGGSYNIKDNLFNGSMIVGAKVQFNTTDSVQLTYQNNFHVNNAKGIEMEETVKGVFNVLLVGDTISGGNTGGSIFLRGNGTWNLTDNVWEGSLGVGLQFNAEIDQGINAKITVNGDVYAGNQVDGLRGIINTQGEIRFTLVEIVSRSNGNNGLWLEGFGGVGGQLFLETSESQFVGNASAGLRLSNGSTVIDLFRAEVERNFMTGNTEGGIFTFGVNLLNSIVNNEIIDNQGPGILLAEGSQARVDSNLLSGNTFGILTTENSFGSFENNTLTENNIAIALTGTGVGTPFLGNLIFNNTSLGIDLGNDGVTPNDQGDVDTGPNNLQNFPELSQATFANNTLVVDGTLNSRPDAIFRLEFFANTACDASGFGEGEQFIGFHEVMTGANGEVNFSAGFNGLVIPVNAFITAIATDTSFNSSEFSACVQVGGNGGPSAADLSLTKSLSTPPSYKVGDTLTFVLKLVNTGPDPASGVEVTDLLPSALSFIAAQPDQGSYNANTGVWTVGNVNTGDTTTLSIEVIIASEGTITNTAEVTASDQNDPDSTPDNANPLEDDQSSVVFEAEAQDIEIEELFSQLAVDIQALVKANALSKGQGKALLIFIRLAEKKIDRNKPQKAIVSLKLFIKLVKILVRVGKLDSEQGEALISSANQIIEVLSNGHHTFAQAKVSTSTKPDPGIRLQVYPNPITDKATVQFELSETMPVRILVYNLQGQEVIRLLEGKLSAGVHQASWDAHEVSNGVYLVCVQTASGFYKEKVLLFR